MFHIRICILSCFVKLSYCANILALIPTPSYSHQIVYAPLWKTLSLRGHNVTVLTTNPLKDPKLTNLTEIDMNWTYNIYSNTTAMLENATNMWNWNAQMSFSMGYICDRMLSSDALQVLFDNESTYDLVLVENLCPEFLAFAEMYNCPKILISTMSLSSIFYSYMGDFVHPVLHPEYVTPFHGELSFKERVLSTVVSWYLQYMFSHRYFPEKDKSVQKYFNSTSTVSELLRDVDMLFLNVNPLIHRTRAVGPATITIGGFRQDLSSQRMSLDVKHFLDNAKEGCVYVSLGSNINSSQLSSRLLETFTTALGELPYKVLWKFEVEVLGLPSNIKIVKWLQQQKVLNHPNLKLFVTHGGLQSIEESIFGEVPLVVIPFCIDQHQNAKIMENKGIAIVLDRRSLTKDELKNAVIKVMTDSKYTDGVKILKRLILDEPMTGLEKAVWWTEYVIRHKGAKHLRNPVVDLPIYQYYLLDVIGFLLILTVVTIAIVILLLKKMYKLLLSVRNHQLKEKSH